MEVLALLLVLLEAELMAWGKPDSHLDKMFSRVYPEPAVFWPGGKPPLPGAYPKPCPTCGRCPTCGGK